MNSSSQPSPQSLHSTCKGKSILCTRSERTCVTSMVLVLLILTIVLTSCAQINAFMIIPPTSFTTSFGISGYHLSTIRRNDLSTLCMARRGNTNKSATSKKRKSTTKNQKSNDTRKGGGGGGGKSKQKGPNNKSKNANQHLPPWQIMNTKDITKNIESEKQRRESIRNGELSSSVTSSTEKTGDVKASTSLLTPTDRQLMNWKRFNPDKDIAGTKFTGAYLGRQLPPELGCPEVAFLGRSNVGKSSLLNRLVKGMNDGGVSSPGSSGSDLARVGKTPGATASVNIYGLQGKKNKLIMGFADLPGFGYAKLSKDVKESVEMAAERYLGKRRELALGILLVDTRRIPSEDDRAVLAALYDLGLPILVVATKVDKIKSKEALRSSLEEVRLGLGLPEGQPFYISSMTGEGVRQLWSIIMDACEDKVEELRDELEGKLQKDDQEIDPDDTIMLDDEGNWIEEEEENTSEGLEWVRNYAYYDESKAKNRKQKQPNEASLMKMRENEAAQAAANEAMKLKKLRQTVKKMERQGEV